MMSKKKDEHKKRKKEEIRKARLAKERARLPIRTSSRDARFADQVTELVKSGYHAEAVELLVPYVEKNPLQAGPLGILVVAAEGCGDYATMYWAAQRLVDLKTDKVEDYVLYFNSCAKCDLVMTTYMAAKLISPFAPRIGGADRFDELLDGFQEAIDGVREMARIEAPVVGETYSDDRLLEFVRIQEQTMLFIKSAKNEWAIQWSDRMIRRFPESPFPFAMKAMAVMLRYGPDKAEEYFQQGLSNFPDSFVLLCYRIRQLAMLSRWEEIPECFKRLDAIPIASTHRPPELTLLKMQSLIWAKQYDVALELYRNVPGILGEAWDVARSPACAGIVHLAAVILAKRGESVDSMFLEAATCPGADIVVMENAEDVEKPKKERNGPWFFGAICYIPELLYDMFDPILRNIPPEPSDDEVDAWIREKVRPICREALRRWPYFPDLLTELVRSGNNAGRHWAGMFIGTCDDPSFIEAVREIAIGTEGTPELRQNYRDALLGAGLVT